MKKLLLMAVAAFTFAITANAQVQRKSDTTQRYQMKQDRHKQMMAQLDLTKEQKEQMKQSRQEMKAQRDAIKNDNSLTADQKKEKMMQIRKKQKESMNSILTKDQKEKMKQYNKNHKKHHGKKGNGNAPRQKRQINSNG